MAAAKNGDAPIPSPRDNKPTADYCCRFGYGALRRFRFRQCRKSSGIRTLGNPDVLLRCSS